MVPYTLALLYMMFYGPGREASDVSYLQINPFQTIRHFLHDRVRFSDFAINIFGNIFVFSPFGLLGLVSKQFLKFSIILPFFMLTIIGIESTQYYTGRGTADVDDVFLNTLGMLLGFFALKFVTQLFSLAFENERRYLETAYS